MAKRVNEKMFNIIRYQRNANMMPSRNDYLPTRIADMEMPTDWCWWRPDTTELQQEGQLLEPFAQACPVFFF